MNPKIEITRARRALRAAESFSYFHGLVSGLHDALYAGADDVAWNYRADAAGDIAIEDVSKLLACCDWTDQPEAAAVVAELQKNPYRFSEPKGEMLVSTACEWVRGISQELVRSVDVGVLTEKDFAALVCAADVLGVIWAVTESWGNEEVQEVCDLAGLAEPIWLCAAGLTATAEYGAVFAGYTAHGLEVVLASGLGTPQHGHDVAASLVARRYRAGARRHGAPAPGVPSA